MRKSERFVPFNGKTFRNTFANRFERRKNGERTPPTPMKPYVTKHKSKHRKRSKKLGAVAS